MFIAKQPHTKIVHSHCRMEVSLIKFAKASFLKAGLHRSYFIVYKLIFFRPFEFLILLMICLNCIALAVTQPYPAQDSDSINAKLVSFFFRICFYFKEYSLALFFVFKVHIFILSLGICIHP